MGTMWSGWVFRLHFSIDIEELIWKDITTIAALNPYMNRPVFVSGFTEETLIFMRDNNIPIDIRKTYSNWKSFISRRGPARVFPMGKNNDKKSLLPDGYIIHMGFCLYVPDETARNLLKLMYGNKLEIMEPTSVVNVCVRSVNTRLHTDFLKGMFNIISIKLYAWYIRKVYRLV